MRRAVAAVAVCIATVACSSGDDVLQQDAGGAETIVSSAQPGNVTGTPTTASSAGDAGIDVHVTIDASAPGAPISPFIVGVSSTLTADEMRSAGIQLNSWGGNPSTRYNYMIGHAWNHGADYEFRNTNYGDAGDSTRGFLRENMSGDVASRVAVPTLGWVALNDDDGTCSFPEGDRCLAATDVGNCEDQKVLADPERANVRSTPEGVADWIAGLLADGLDIRYVAMDNEPELWGYTHYDVHPECPTYEEILDKYLAHARAIREVAPDVALTGPVMCCWYDYWNLGPGPADGSDQDFLEWFLQQVKAHDDGYGQRTLDVVDVHFYPQSEVFNENVDAETNARRLRSTRALWDPGYVDESWLRTPIRFIPRLRELIERTYPGTPLMISEWNFGADKDINGALTIAEVLGIYGREGVDAAAYWRNPEVGSPGFLAFTMHGNYDGAGSRFGGQVVPVESSDLGRVSSFAAVDGDAGLLRVMLINKDPESSHVIGLDVAGFEPAQAGRTFTLSAADPTQIVAGRMSVGGGLTLPTSSITVLELQRA